jgi:hypothetical protein
MGHYEGGRYDTILTLTPEIKAFIESWTKIAINPPFSKGETVSLLQKALDSHKRLVKACKQGQSHVLHLSSLGLSRLVHCDITTSHPGAQPGYELGSFTDTAPGIIGISYLIKNSDIQVSIKTDYQYLGYETQLQRQLEHSVRLLDNLHASF